jgi:hypothetical protein
VRGYRLSVIGFRRTSGRWSFPRLADNPQP